MPSTAEYRARRVGDRPRREALCSDIENQKKCRHQAHVPHAQSSPDRLGQSGPVISTTVGNHSTSAELSAKRSRRGSAARGIPRSLSPRARTRGRRPTRRERGCRKSSVPLLSQLERREETTRVMAAATATNAAVETQEISNLSFVLRWERRQRRAWRLSPFKDSIGFRANPRR